MTEAEYIAAADLRTIRDALSVLRNLIGTEPVVDVLRILRAEEERLCAVVDECVVPEDG